MLLPASVFLSLAAIVPFTRAAIYNSVEDLPDLGRYDYVVVGAGPGGSVITNRLSENSDINVLLLEAGPSHQGVAELGAPFYFWMGIPSEYNWNYTTVPQSGLDGREVAYPRGHVLGGSSALNGMVYNRGSSDDYNKLAEVVGDSRWNWDSMLQSFKSLETFSPPRDGIGATYDPDVHGYEGPLTVSLPGFSQTIDQFVLELIDNPTYPATVDPNSGNALGFGWQVSTINNGTRNTGATAFLDRYLDRPNLDVLVNAPVTRVLSSDGSRVDTVEFQQGGRANTIQVSRDIVLSAGAVNTPHILLNSGIGDSDELSALGITPFHHLPDVGKNMSDTAVMYISWEVDSDSTFDLLLNDDAAREEAFALWDGTRTGRVSNGVINLTGFLRMNESDPEVQAILEQYGDPTSGPLAPHYEMLFIDGGLAGAQQKNFFSMLVGVVAPWSRGSITLNSADPAGPPNFDPGYMTSDYDMFVMHQALKDAFRLTSSGQFASYLKTPTNGLAEAIASVGSDDATAMDSLVKNSIQNGAHVVGTASMSPFDASWGVVNPDLRVKGLQGLRVVDASVYPFVPGGATQLPTYGLAEHAAAIIKEDW